MGVMVVVVNDCEIDDDGGGGCDEVGCWKGSSFVRVVRLNGGDEWC